MAVLAEQEAVAQVQTTAAVTNMAERGEEGMEGEAAVPAPVAAAQVAT